MNHSKKIALMLICITSINNAYEFSFYNNTDKPLGIGIRFATDDPENEPLYKVYIKPGAMNNIVPGRREVPDIKWSFCLQDVYYIIDPTMAQRAHYFAKATWRKVPITWTDSPIKTSKSPRQTLLTKKQRLALTKRRFVTKRNKPTDQDKSLCRDRHFEITQNEHGTLIVTGSTAEQLYPSREALPEYR
jgi:hypothetical protein